MPLDYGIQTALSTLVPGAGELLSGLDSQEAMNLLNQAADAEGNISLPQLKNLILEKIPPTQLAQLREDPTYRAQQAEADAQLNEVIQGGGLTLADKAALDGIRSKLSLSTTAANNQITNQMAQRGTLDSGSQLAMELANNQNAAQTEAGVGEATAGQAQARLFQAIQQRNANATAGISRKWNEDAQVAAATDAINKGNTDIQNVMNTYNTVTLPQQQFQNQLAVNQAKANAAQLKAGVIGSEAKDVTGASPLGKADIGLSVLQAYKGGNAGANAAPGGDPSQNPYGPGGGAPNYNPSEGNLNSAGTPPPTPGGGTGDPSDWNSFPSSSAAVSGASTKTKSGDVITAADGTTYTLTGYDANGNPLYSKGNGAAPSQGRNF